jgi:peroxiredoxin
LSREFGDKGLAVISVSVDDPEDEAKVLDFLNSQDAAFDNLISQYGASIKSGEEFGFDGAVPLYQLFDRTGKMAYQFRPPPFYTDLENGEPVDRLDARVRQLLSGS